MNGQQTTLSFHRRYSTVHREMRTGRAVFVKQYRHGDWGWSADVMQARTAREADIIQRLRESTWPNARFGTLDLISSDPVQAMLVTAAVEGTPLQDRLLDDFRRLGSRECLRALLIAGGWLRLFQELSTTSADAERIGENDPLDLVTYCTIRVRTIQSLGYGWMTRARGEHLVNAVGRLQDQAMQDDRRQVWCHGDYAAGNLLWDGRVLTAIDFAMAKLDVPLADVAYFIHRLQMLRIYFPWRRWPIDLWTRAFLRGYGRPDAECSPMYRALMIRHLLCRLQTYVRRPPDNLKQTLHVKWIRRCVRDRLLKELARSKH